MIELTIKRNVKITKEDNHVLSPANRKKDEAWLRVYDGNNLILELYCDEVTASPTHMNKDRNGDSFEPAIPMAGKYKNAMVPGKHKGRNALVNQGITPIAFRRGYHGPINLKKFRGINFHDDKEVSLGCFLAPKEFIELCYEQALAHSKYAKAHHPASDMPLIDLILLED